MPAFVPDPQQKQAIEHVAGPMLVVAGAGTGKTTVLTRRIAQLISAGHARPDEILAVTYTRKAAAELRHRLAALGIDVSGLRACNFHQYCYRLLERNRAAFDVLNQQDLWIYLRRHFAELPLRHFVEARSPDAFLEPLLDFFEACGDELVTAGDYAAYVERLARHELPLPRIGSDELDPDSVLALCREISAVFNWVEAALAREGLGTFGAIVLRAVALLESDAGLLEHERRRARFILVDEFQDSNIAQIELAALLAGDGGNLFAVGDPDQSIYRFRGASSAAFDEFLRRYPKARTVVLDLNRRSLPPILECASTVIAMNPPIVSAGHPDFARRPLLSWRAQQGNHARPKVSVVLARGTPEAGWQECEAAEVATTIRDVQAATGCRWRDFAVLYRGHAQREHVAAEFAARRIPIDIAGVDALETPEVRDLVAVLRAVELREALGIFRVAALPQFGIPAPALATELHRGGKGADVVAALQRVPGGSAVLAALEQSFGATRGLDAPAAAEFCVQQFDFTRSAPLGAFLAFVADWRRRRIAGDGRLAGFLEYLQFFPDCRGKVPIGSVNEFEEGEDAPLLEQSNAVRLMTIHAAKGLEFPHVFVLRVQSQALPSNYHPPLFGFPKELRRELTRTSADPKDLHVEEERRLFYVSMTRARDMLTLTARPKNARDTQPARFLREMMAVEETAAAWQRHEARPYRVELRAAAAPAAVNVGAWMLAPPRAPLAGPLSASSIDTYETCPLQFKLSKEWNLPGEVSGPLLFGNVVHLVLQGYYDALAAGRPMTVESAIALFRDAMAAAPFDRDIQRELYLRQGIEQLTAFLEARRREPPPDIVSTERNFEITVAGVPVRGRLDRIDRIEGERVAILDYKTGRARDQKDADKSLQLSIYAIAARERWKATAEKLLFVNIATGEAVETRRTDDQLLQAAERVRAVADAVASGAFDPSPGYHCRSCAYRQLCPATEERLYDIAAAAQAD